MYIAIVTVTKHDSQAKSQWMHVRVGLLPAKSESVIGISFTPVLETFQQYHAGCTRNGLKTMYLCGKSTPILRRDHSVNSPPLKLRDCVTAWSSTFTSARNNTDHPRIKWVNMTYFHYASATTKTILVLRKYVHCHRYCHETWQSSKVTMNACTCWFTSS